MYRSNPRNHSEQMKLRDIIRNIIIKSLRGESISRQMFNSCRGNARHIETIQFNSHKTVEQFSSALAVMIYNNNSSSCFLLSSTCRKTLLFRKKTGWLFENITNALCSQSCVFEKILWKLQTPYTYIKVYLLASIAAFPPSGQTVLVA